MPFRMITEKVIEIGTSFFVILSSGHYDLPDRNVTPIHTTAVTAVQTLSETASTLCLYRKYDFCFLYQIDMEWR